jgi:hypothetical protein
MKDQTASIEDLEPELHDAVRTLVDLSERETTLGYLEKMVQENELDKEKIRDIIKRFECLSGERFQGTPSFDIEYSRVDSVYTADENPPGVDHAYDVKVYGSGFHVATLTVFALGREYGDVAEFSTWKLRDVSMVI